MISTSLDLHRNDSGKVHSDGTESIVHRGKTDSLSVMGLTVHILFMMVRLKIILSMVMRLTVCSP